MHYGTKIVLKENLNLNAPTISQDILNFSDYKKIRIYVPIRNVLLDIEIFT